MKYPHLLAVAVAASSFLSLHAQVGPIFENGQAQKVPAFENPKEWIREDLWVETEFDTDGDGVLDRMHVDVTRPAQTNEGLKLPVIYESSPYYAGTAGNDRDLFWNVSHELGEVPAPPRHPEVVRKGQRPIISNSQVFTWVPRGYIVVHSSSPGGVEALKAIIPVAPNTSYYHYYRSNGLVRSPGGYLGEDIDVLYEFIHSGEESKRAFGNRTVRDELMRANMDRATGDYNDFWAGRDYLHDMEPMKAALLMSHGFNDWNVMPEHSYRIYNRAREMGLPVQIYYHQAGHGGPPPMDLMNRWFTHYLFGIDNGVENDPRAWIVRERVSPKDPTPYADYPHPGAQPVTLKLTKGGKKSGGLSTRKASKRNEKLVDDVTFAGTELAKASTSKNRLLYVSPILKEDLHISGLASLEIRVSSSKPAANLSVWLVSLPWNEAEDALIYDNIITRGWADPQNHESISRSEPLLPGEFYTLKFDLQPDDQVIPAGQQIGLMIFSSDQEFTLHPQPGTVLKVDLRGTTLTLPVVGGEEAYQAATN
ncbi:MAG: Xaa-Pro dipeptidyl-peptidase [Flavobacteriia bacterium]|nr:Xaa-Pro dipeptidyl-peptidase [Flavobacteriia bacterium]